MSQNPSGPALESQVLALANGFGSVTGFPGQRALSFMVSGSEASLDPFSQLCSSLLVGAVAPRGHDAPCVFLFWRFLSMLFRET